jgi:hypothetical protein
MKAREAAGVELHPVLRTPKLLIVKTDKTKGVDFS